MILLVLFILLACFGFFLLKLTFDFAKRRGRVWGLNLRPVSCPKCGENVPFLRKPASLRQELWGGWTCSNCGIEMDRWGTEISSSEDFQTVREKLSQPSGFVEAFDERGKTPIERVFNDEGKGS